MSELISHKPEFLINKNTAKLNPIQSRIELSHKDPYRRTIRRVKISKNRQLQSRGTNMRIPEIERTPLYEFTEPTFEKQTFDLNSNNIMNTQTLDQ